MTKWLITAHHKSVCVCVRQCEPCSAVNLLDWDLEVLQPTAFPCPEVGLLIWDQRFKGLQSSVVEWTCTIASFSLLHVHAKSIVLTCVFYCTTTNEASDLSMTTSLEAQQPSCILPSAGDKHSLGLSSRRISCFKSHFASYLLMLHGRGHHGIRG